MKVAARGLTPPSTSSVAGGSMFRLPWRSLLGFSSLRNSGFVPAKNLFLCLTGARFLHRSRVFSLVFMFRGTLPVIFAVGCASSRAISVTLSPSSDESVQQRQTINISVAVVNDRSNDRVTSSLSGAACSGGCGSLTGQTTTTATYNAPTAIPTNLTVTLTAASWAQPSTEVLL